VNTTNPGTTDTSSTLLQNFISDDELRRELRISDRTLRRLRLKARLPSVRLGQQLYFRRESVGMWLDALAAIRGGMRKGPRRAPGTQTQRERVRRHR